MSRYEGNIRMELKEMGINTGQLRIAIIREPL
jgi:hypothetical protein